MSDNSAAIVTSDTITSDNDLLDAITANGCDFDELPVAFNQVEPGNIHGLRIDFATPAAGVNFELLRKDTSLKIWGETLHDAYDNAGIEKIEMDNHHSVTAWMDKDGVWHETLEGNYLTSML